MGLSPRSAVLRDELVALHQELRAQTRERHGRINPFAEDLFPWKERGEYWCSDDRGVTIYNSTTIMGDVEIGANTWVGPFCNLDGSGGLIIGEFCSISSGAQLLTHDTVRWALSGGRSEYDRAPVRIGNCCFIGTHAIITKGVSIGDHSLIAAGAVVTHDVPAYSIVAGVPARVIGRVQVSPDAAVTLDYHAVRGGHLSDDVSA